MSDVQGSQIKKAFLYALIGSVVVSAALGILAILSGDYGSSEIRILLTTVTIAAASMCGLSCGAYLATKRGQTLPLAGVFLTLSAAAMVIVGIWSTTISSGYWKVAVSVSVFAIACAHLSLLSLARLAAWFRWSLVAAHVVIFAVASLIVAVIVLETDGLGMFPLLGVAAIIDAAITISIPILHRLSRADFAASGALAASPADAVIDAELAQLRARITELERRKARKT